MTMTLLAAHEGNERLSKRAGSRKGIQLDKFKV
jgi:hypothetical protein